MNESVSLYNNVIEQLSQLIDDQENISSSLLPDLQRELAAGHRNAATVLLKQKRAGEAAGHYRSAIESQVALTERYPALAVYKSDLSRSRLGLGQTLHTLKDDPAGEIFEL